MLGFQQSDLFFLLSADTSLIPVPAYWQAQGRGFSDGSFIKSSISSPVPLPSVRRMREGGKECS